MLGGYALRQGVAHDLAAGRIEGARARVTNFDWAQTRTARIGSAPVATDAGDATQPTEDTVSQLCDDYTAVARSVPAGDDAVQMWAAFMRERAHILRRGEPEWATNKILLQLAVEHADDSLVTRAAETSLGHLAARGLPVRFAVNSRRPLTWRQPARWSLDDADVVAHSTGADGSVIVATRCVVRAFSPATGTLRWMVELDHTVVALALDESATHIAAWLDSGVLVLIDGATGLMLAQTHCPDPSGGLALVVRGPIAIAVCQTRSQSLKTVRFAEDAAPMPSPVNLLDRPWHCFAPERLRFLPDVDRIVFRTPSGHWLGWRVDEFGPPMAVDDTTATEASNRCARRAVPLHGRCPIDDQTWNDYQARWRASGLADESIAGVVVGDNGRFAVALRQTAKFMLFGAAQRVLQHPEGEFVHGAFSGDMSRLHVLVHRDAVLHWSVYDTRSGARLRARRSRLQPRTRIMRLAFVDRTPGVLCRLDNKRLPYGFRRLAVDVSGHVTLGPRQRLHREVARAGTGESIGLFPTLGREANQCVELSAPGIRERHIASSSGRRTVAIHLASYDWTDLSCGTHWATWAEGGVVTHDTDLATLEVLPRPHVVDSVVDIGDALVVADRTSQVVVLDVGRDGPVTVCAFSWTGNSPRLLPVDGSMVCAWQRPCLRVLELTPDLVAAAASRVLPHHLEVSVLAHDSSNERILSAGYGGLSVCVWCARTGDMVSELPDPRHGIHRIWVSSGGAFACVQTVGAGRDLEQWVWKIEDQRLVARFNSRESTGRWFGPAKELIAGVWSTQMKLFDDHGNGAPGAYPSLEPERLGPQASLSTGPEWLPGQWFGFARKNALDDSGFFNLRGERWYTDQRITAELRLSDGTVWLGGGNGDVWRLVFRQ